MSTTSTTVPNISIPSIAANSPAIPQTRSIRSNIQWTLLGYFAYGVCQWLMLIVVARLGLPEMVGQFALAMAVTTPIILLVGLDLRTVQATDQSNRYPFEDFFTVRVVTLVLAMIIITAFAFVSGYKQETTLLILVMGIAKCIEAISDLCHGTLQQHERLDQMAKARILRGIVSVAVLSAGLYAFQSLLLATACMAIVWTAVLVCYDWPVTFRLLRRSGQSTKLLCIRPKQFMQLLVAAFPTGILSCQASLEQNLPRLCIDKYMGERELGIYSAVSSMIIAATLIINAVHCAVLPRIAKHLTNHQTGQVWGMLLRLSGFGAMVGFLGIAAVSVFGGWFLGLAFGPEYATQGPLLFVLMLGATIRYATLPFSTGFRAARRFWLLAILQTVSLVAALPILMLLVQNYHGMGAAYASVAVALLFAAIQVPAALWAIKSPAETHNFDDATTNQKAGTMRGAA